MVSGWSRRALVISGATIVAPGRPATERDELIAAGPILSTDMPASSTITQELLGWKPTHPGLIENIEQGHYFI